MVFSDSGAADEHVDKAHKQEMHNWKEPDPYGASAGVRIDEAQRFRSPCSIAVQTDSVAGQ